MKIKNKTNDVMCIRKENDNERKRINELESELSKLRSCKEIVEERYVGKYVKAIETIKVIQDRSNPSVVSEFLDTTFMYVNDISYDYNGRPCISGPGGRFKDSTSYVVLSNKVQLCLDDDVFPEEITKEEFEDLATNLFRKVSETTEMGEV